MELAEQLKTQRPLRVLVRNRRTKEVRFDNGSNVNFLETKTKELNGFGANLELSSLANETMKHYQTSNITPSFEYQQLRIVADHTENPDNQRMLVDVLERFSKMEVQNALMKDMLLRYAPELLEKITIEETPF